MAPRASREFSIDWKELPIFAHTLGFPHRTSCELKKAEEAFWKGSNWTGPALPSVNCAHWRVQKDYRHRMLPVDVLIAE